MRYFLILIIFTLTNFNTFGQKASEKVIAESCDCMQKDNNSLNKSLQAKLAMDCIGMKTGKYFNELKREFKISATDINVAWGEVNKNLVLFLPKRCPELFVQIWESKRLQNPADTQIVNIDTLKLERNICNNFKTGKFTTIDLYINEFHVPVGDSKSHSEVNNGFRYEYEENGKYYTKWAIKFFDDCHWEHTLIKTNSPNSKKFWDVGEKFEFKAIGSTKDGNLYVASKWLNMEFIALIKKIE